MTTIMNWEAYNQGFAAWDEYLKTNIKPGNPYPKESEPWYSWNRGWNSNAHDWESNLTKSFYNGKNS